MKTFIKSFILVTLTIILFNQIGEAICPANTTRTVIFFTNGVDNDPEKAQESIDKLMGEILSQISGTSIQEDCLDFAKAYNHNEFYFLDYFESGRQVLGEFSSQFWRFWANLEPLPDWFQEATLDSAASVDLFAYVIDSDLRDHLEQYKAVITRNENVVVVAHSQGNLYANEAFELLSTEERRKYKIVAVATPSGFVGGGGPHVTLHEDVWASFIFPPTRLPSNERNEAFPPCGEEKDWSCHKFIETYLNGNKSGPLILGHIVDAITAHAESATQLVAYVTHSTARSVSVISVPDNNIIATPQVTARPAKVIFIPNSKFAYITGGNFRDPQLMVLDVSSHSQITHLSVRHCSDITITPDGAFAYLSDCDPFGPDIIKIQTSNHTVAEIIRLRGILPPANDIAVSPNGTFLYMIHESDKSLSVMQISDNFFIQKTSPIFEDFPRNIVFAHDGEQAYATQFNPQDNIYELLVINTKDVNNISVERKVPLSGNPVDIALTPKGDFIYMTIDLGPSHEVAIIRTTDYATLPPIPLETNLVGIAITPDGNFAYVAIHGAFPEDGNEVAVIETPTNTVVDRIPTQTGPGFIAIAEVPVP